MRSTGLLAAIMVLGLLPATAEAGWKIDRALATAHVVWGGQLERTCPQGVTVAAVDPKEAEAGNGVPLSNATAWATAGVCAVNINATRRKQLRSYEPLCSIVLHETGHIIGLGHAAKGIMRVDPAFASSSGRVAGRKVEEWTGTDRRCQRRGRPYLEAWGVLTPRR